MIKRLLLILAAIVLLVAGWFIYSFYFRTASYEKLVGERLEKAVRKGSDSLYKLEYEHIIINPVTLSVSMQGIHLHSDSVVLSRLLQRGDTPVMLLDLRLKNLSLKDLSAKSLVADKELKLSAIIVDEADIEIRKISKSKKRELGYNPDSFDVARLNLFKMISDDIHMLQIDSVRLLNTKFHYKSQIRKYKEFNIEKLDITLRNILVDSSSVLEKDRFFLAKSCSIKLDSYQMPLNELYRLECASFNLEIPSGKGFIDSFRLVPEQTEMGFVKKVVTDMKRVQIDIPRLDIEGLNAITFFEEELVRVKKLTLTDMAIDVYHNKHSPKDTTDKTGEYPHQLLMAMNIDLDVREIEVKNASVAYRQDNPKSKQQGKLLFTRINASLENISNNIDSLNKKDFVSMSATGYLLGITKLRSEWKFYNLKKNGNFSISGSLDAMDAKQLNRVLIPLGMVKVEDGRINSIAFTINGTDHEGNGDVSFMYENFKVAVLEREDNKLEKQKSKSMLANKLFLNEHNRKDDKIPDQKRAHFKRDPHRNLFHLIWNTMLDGMKGTLQHGKAAAKLLKGLKKKEQP